MLQALQVETFGKCEDFAAVPGCGLRCKVSNIHHMLKEEQHVENLVGTNNRRSTISLNFRSEVLENVLIDRKIHNSPQHNASSLAADLIQNLNESGNLNYFDFSLVYYNKLRILLNFKIKSRHKCN